MISQCLLHRASSLSVGLVNQSRSHYGTIVFRSIPPLSPSQIQRGFIGVTKYQRQHTLNPFHTPQWRKTTTRSTSTTRLPTTLKSQANEQEEIEQQLSTIQQSLHDELTLLGIDATALSQAAHESIINTMNGFDPQFGKSAIKAYRTHVSPSTTEKRLARLRPGDAARAARQLEFLIQRNKSHSTDWVRHTDAEDYTTTGASHGEDIDAMDDYNLTQRQLLPLVLILDNVRSAFNVGSIFRTADACNCCYILTTGITPHPDGSGADKLRKSSLGADRSLPSSHFRTTKEAIEYLRKEKPYLTLIGMETTDRSVGYTSFQYPGGGKNQDGETSSSSDYVVGDSASSKGSVQRVQYGELPTEGTALILGNEVTGIDADIMMQLDAIVEIPMLGVKNSLNIAACAPVVLYEVLRQWGVLDQYNENTQCR